MNCTAFFILSHERNHFAFFNALREYANAVAFCGHWHMSNADWKTIFLDDFGFGFFPTIQVGACRMDGKERLAKGDRRPPSQQPRQQGQDNRNDF